MQKNKHRAGLIRKIKTIQRRTMSDVEYYALLDDRYGKQSATKLTIKELQDLCSLLDTLTGQAQQPQKPRANAQARKIWMLWQELHKAGIVQTPTEAALNQFIIRRCRVDVESYRWLNSYQGNDVIEILKQWLTRVGAS